MWDLLFLHAVPWSLNKYYLSYAFYVLLSTIQYTANVTIQYMLITSKLPHNKKVPALYHPLQITQKINKCQFNRRQKTAHTYHLSLSISNYFNQIKH